MDDYSGERHTHKSLGEVLGALGPGGTAAIRFEDYTRLFGTEPTEDELEGQRAAGTFAAKHGCEHSVDHTERRVTFTKS